MNLRSCLIKYLILYIDYIIYTLTFRRMQSFDMINKQGKDYNFCITFAVLQNC